MKNSQFINPKIWFKLINSIIIIGNRRFRAKKRFPTILSRKIHLKSPISSSQSSKNENGGEPPKFRFKHFLVTWTSRTPQFYCEHRVHTTSLAWICQKLRESGRLHQNTDKISQFIIIKKTLEIRWEPSNTNHICESIIFDVTNSMEP